MNHFRDACVVLGTVSPPYPSLLNQSGIVNVALGTVSPPPADSFWWCQCSIRYCPVSLPVDSFWWCSCMLIHSGGVNVALGIIPSLSLLILSGGVSVALGIIPSLSLLIHSGGVNVALSIVSSLPAGLFWWCHFRIRYCPPPSFPVYSFWCCQCSVKCCLPNCRLTLVSI